MERQGRIAVIGSMNRDVVLKVKTHPLPGETVYSADLAYNHGGKGANQAVAAAKSGAQVVMIGAVGMDDAGADFISSLQAQGICTSGIKRKEGDSGQAFIQVDEAAENCIILSPGANGRLTPEDVQQAWTAAATCSAVFIQNEIPYETSMAAIIQAAATGKRVYYNPAPAIRLQQEALSAIHCLILNEIEAATVLEGDGIEDTDRDAEETVRQLLAAGVESVILTLGARGAMYADRSGQWYEVAAFQVQAVDTTAAGDTFIGAYGAMREIGEDVAYALHYAAAAAALCVTQHGAQSSIPTRTRVESFLQHNVT
ncbi:ribokinase [Paenibacillus daejeonensis]|uniref:ribokinase n=1 Tax=Paenibacillus daejeonensis TaxID=135193 RepID=UPI0003786309|nr:ribokinase [Paenibacillus daejeonensis]